jgi:hypothetical protein
MRMISAQPISGQRIEFLIDVRSYPYARRAPQLA